MVSEKEIEALKNQLKAILEFEKIGDADNENFKLWKAKTERILERINSVEATRFVNIRFELSNMWDYEVADRRAEFLEGLKEARVLIQSIIDDWEKFEKGKEKKPKEKEKLKVFIAHGKKRESLMKLKEFLEALGVDPVIAKMKASKGKGLDIHVDKLIEESDCAIILATGEDKVGDILQPRGNVIHEIGVAQEKLKDKVIYLLEKGCVFPSNIHPRVWESFTEDSMDAAFVKVIRELKAFGFI